MNQKAESDGKRLPQVRKWLDKLHESINECSEKVEGLCGRMESLQLPDVPPNTAETATPLEELAPVANILRDLCFQVEAITNNAEKHLQRLEI